MMMFEDAEVGDKVILEDGYFTDDLRFTLRQVKRVTKRYIEVSGTLYHKDTGAKRGGKHSMTYNNRILPTTDENLRLLHNANLLHLRNRVTRYANDKIKLMTIEQLEELDEFLGNMVVTIND